MNEPLNNPNAGISFSGKSYNKHPQWYNQPLRLTKEQKRDPLPVLDDFFECYHLNEVRQTLWEWLTDVLSSQRSITLEPLDRNNHIYFYEKIETVIEAVLIIKMKMHKHRRRWEKRKLKTEQPLAAQQAKPKEKIVLNQPLQSVTMVTGDEILNKKRRLLEYVNDDPLYVIKEVFNPDQWCFISIALQEWLYIGLSSDDNAYCDSEGRQNLIIFNDQLLLLVEALFIITLQNISDASLKEEFQKNYAIHLLNQFQIANPEQVIAAFFEKYPLEYSMRELEDWLEAGISHGGPWRDEITCPWHVLDTYRNILCLIKAAKQLLTR